MGLRSFIVVGLGILIWTDGDAAEFDSPPLRGDRVVGLRWQPDEDDPIFNGNAVLQILEEHPFVHQPGNRVIAASPIGLTRDAYSYATGENSVVRFNMDTGETVSQLPVQSSEDIIDLGVHASGRFVAALYASGAVEYWDTADDGGSSVFQAAEFPLEDIVFAEGVSDTLDERFAVAGQSSNIYVYDGPENLLYQMNVPDGATRALAMSRQGNLLFTGGDGMRIRQWDITSQPQAPAVFFVQHQGSVRNIEVSPLTDRLASVDETGRVIISQVRNGLVLAEFDVDVSAGTPELEFSNPNGSVLSIARPDGVLELRDGTTGRFFRELLIGNNGITSYAATSDGRSNIVGDDDGRLYLVRAGRCVPSLANPVCFGGYKIWRNTVPDTAGIRLLRVYGFGDSTWSFVDEQREFSDPDSIIARVAPPQEGDPTDEIRRAGPHNGVSYFYSITRFDRQFLNGSVFDVDVNSIMEGFYRDPGESEPTAIVPTPDGRTDLPLLGEVYVVPNPYEAGKVPWDAQGGEHVEFRNLPEKAKIRIYGVAGDLIRILEHDRDRYGTSRASASWDLRNSAGKRVTSGVYTYRIETSSGEALNGYFIVVL